MLDRVTFHVPDVADLSEIEYPDTVAELRASPARARCWSFR